MGRVLAILESLTGLLLCRIEVWPNICTAYARTWNLHGRDGDRRHVAVNLHKLKLFPVINIQTMHVDRDVGYSCVTAEKEMFCNTFTTSFYGYIGLHHLRHLYIYAALWLPRRKHRSSDYISRLLSQVTSAFLFSFFFLVLEFKSPLKRNVFVSRGSAFSKITRSTSTGF